MFRKFDISSAVIHGGLPKDERRQMLQDFHNGKIRVITNCQVLTEGWDEPSINCIIHAAPTKSSLLYTQKTGRGTRLSPETGKSDCLVIDVVDITKRHSLVTVADLVGLPPRFDFKGEDILTIAKQVETERRLNHHLQFDDCESLDDVRAKVEDVDLFIPQIAEVVKQNAELAWTQTTPDHFRVSYSGEGFPEAIDLRADMLGKWTVEFSSGFKKAQMIAKTQDSLPEAFAAAEKWMSVNRPRTFRNKSQKANWRKARPTDAQVREINRQGLNLNWREMTSGEVSDVLDHRHAQKIARARVRAGAA
jgi:superfamily II DNA/RNA helicase